MLNTATFLQANEQIIELKQKLALHLVFQDPAVEKKVATSQEEGLEEVVTITKKDYQMMWTQIEALSQRLSALEKGMYLKER